MFVLKPSSRTRSLSLLGVFAGATFVLAGCGDSSNTGTVETSGGPAAAAPTSFKVGDTIKVGDNLMYTVSGVTAPYDSGNEFDVATKGQFMLVTVTFLNNGAKSVNVSSALSFTLHDATGQTYTETIVVGAANPPDGEIAKGDKLAGTLAFDVPKGQDFKLYYKNDIFSNGSVIVDLGTH